jgi:Tfp pilus assembly protein PilO
MFFFLFLSVKAQDSDFVAVKMVKRESVSAGRMIVIAYISFFVLILGYVFFISRRISLVNSKLSELELLHKDKDESNN